MAVPEKVDPKNEPVKVPAVDDLEPLEEPVEDAPVLEPEGQPDPNVHPLVPGGRRFEQVYAEAKNAGRERDAERDRRIAAEAKLELLSAASPKPVETEKEYTWAELETFITAGRISRADAEAHREEVLTRKLSNKLKGDFTIETKVASRAAALDESIVSYISAVPAINVVGSEDRTRLDQEFDFLASVQGVDASKLSPVDRKVLQLTALRTVYGPIDSLVKRNAQPVNETHQGLPGGSPPRQKPNSDQALLDKLTKSQVTHYKKMMAAGRYKGGWKEVVEELKYVPPARSR